MTRRILAGFLGVLAAMLLLVVVPLGLRLTSQERSDFVASTKASARSLAAVAEESLGDVTDPAEQRSPKLLVEAGDAAMLLDRAGNVVVTAGRPFPEGVIRPGNRVATHVDGSIVVTALVGSAAHPDGRVILARDAAPLEHREHKLWLLLAAATAVAVALGSAVAWLLARWIARPLRPLQSAAARLGHGEIAARAEAGTGPPELRELATTFNEMAARIASLLDRQRNMTADVSHQLRTPLSALRLRLELLADDVPVELRADLADAQRELARLNRLVDGLLAVARAEEARTMPKSTDVAAVVEERVEMWRPVADDKQVGLSSSTCRASVAVTPGHLEQILDNLIANSLEALAAGERVEVSAVREERHIVLTVADNGPGMTAAHRAEAFTRYGGEAAAGKSGLGLAIVSRLVRADHGSIDLDETAGGGLSVVVRLPAA
jgi:signal transduction histidine kinase